MDNQLTELNRALQITWEVDDAFFEHHIAFDAFLLKQENWTTDEIETIGIFDSFEEAMAAIGDR